MSQQGRTIRISTLGPRTPPADSVRAVTGPDAATWCPIAQRRRYLSRELAELDLERQVDLGLVDPEDRDAEAYECGSHWHLGRVGER